jgi:hypothetical protein
MRTVPKRLAPRRPSGAATRTRGRRPAKGAADAADAERRAPFRVSAPPAVPGARETAERDDFAKRGEAAATANKKKSVEEWRSLLCKLTDLELSGAPQLATREADRGRPTRPLERLVRFQAHDVAEGNTKLTERRRTTRSTAPASQECCRSHRR